MTAVRATTLRPCPSRRCMPMAPRSFAPPMGNALQTPSAFPSCSTNGEATAACTMLDGLPSVRCIVVHADLTFVWLPAALTPVFEMVRLHTHYEWPLNSHPRALKLWPTQQIVHVNDVPSLSLLSNRKILSSSRLKCVPAGAVLQICQPHQASVSVHSPWCTQVSEMLQ